MTIILDNLVRALRSELQDYGELLARLDEEQQCVLRRAPDGLLSAVDSIEEQSAAVQQARLHREECRKKLAAEFKLQPNSSLADLIRALPHDYRPLVSALMEENNELLKRVQQRARQNHLLLSRSVELMQSFLGTLFQVGQGSTYDHSGGASRGAVPSRTLYEAVG
jgi:flagellar biosynthesis/type III secretory pathway chaperone